MTPPNTTPLNEEEKKLGELIDDVVPVHLQDYARQLIQTIEKKARIDEIEKTMSLNEIEPYSGWGKNRKLGFKEGQSAINSYLRPRLDQLNTTTRSGE